MEAKITGRNFSKRVYQLHQIVLSKREKLFNTALVYEISLSF